MPGGWRPPGGTKAEGRPGAGGGNGGNGGAGRGEAVLPDRTKPEDGPMDMEGGGLGGSKTFGRTCSRARRGDSAMQHDGRRPPLRRQV